MCGDKALQLGFHVTLGYSPENNARTVRFDIRQYLEKWADAKPEIIVRRPGESAPYIAVSTTEDGVISWLITRADTAIAGNGELWVAFRRSENDLYGLSPKTVTRILEGAPGGADENPPSAAEPWVQRVIDAAHAAQESEENAAQSADRAEQAAATQGYVFFEIDANGRLIMTKTENVENLDFQLNNGRLEVVYG